MFDAHAITATALPIMTQMVIGLALFAVITICTRRWSLGCSMLMLGAYVLAFWQPALFYASVTLGSCSVVALIVMAARGPRKLDSQ